MAQFEAKEERLEVSDYRAFFDSHRFRVWHLEGREKTYRIADVMRLSTSFMGNKKKQPQVYLETVRGKRIELPLALNATNAKVIARLYGNDPRKWMGQLITLYPTTTESPQGMVDCIRIRPTKPRGPAGNKPATDKPEPVREPGDDTDEEEPPMGALEEDNA